VAVIAGVAAAGALLLVSAWTSPPPERIVARRDWSRLTRPVLSGVVVGSAAFALTGWVVAGVAGVLAGFAGMQAWQRRRRGGAKAEQARVEALAAWCEQLRDLLSAEHGVIGTIVATARTCPDAIRPEVEMLAAQLGRQRPETAVREFAATLDDPSGDLVASVLLLAMSRSSRTSELLSELALTIRERAAMRLRVEADRAGQRSEARFIIGFSAVFIGGIAIFGRGSDFLDAYDSATGQLVLLLTAVLFTLGIRWLSRLTRFASPARFLAVGVVVDDVAEVEP
jgi:Flp pilus assembly protein TadB